MRDAALFAILGRRLTDLPCTRCRGRGECQAMRAIGFASPGRGAGGEKTRMKVSAGTRLAEGLRG
jgi:hypothetical protein